MASVLSNITATLGVASGGAVTFDFTARGKHSRFIVGIDKTDQRLTGKAAKAKGLHG